MTNGNISTSLVCSLAFAYRNQPYVFRLLEGSQPSLTQTERDSEIGEILGRDWVYRGSKGEIQKSLLRERERLRDLPDGRKPLRRLAFKRKKLASGDASFFDNLGVAIVCYCQNKLREPDSN